MSDQRDGGISWTEQTWNPIRGCSRISGGCRNCYAETMAARFSGPGQPYEGLAKSTPSGPRWTGKVRLVEDHLTDPLRWTRPRMIFVNSMSDLFHEALTNEEIAAVFGVMAAAPRHTFQVLTKRAKRMREWFAWLKRERSERLAHMPPRESGPWELDLSDLCVQYVRRLRGARLPETLRGYSKPWPLPNVWLGVSVEDQASADERIPHILETPAAVRWVSYEPALGPVDFANIPTSAARNGILKPLVGLTWGTRSDGLYTTIGDRGPRLDWIVVGGESGPGARPFDVEWARSTIRACKAAGVPVFVKQLGAGPFEVVAGHAGPPKVEAYGGPVALRDKKGGDPSEWPEDLRVREWPMATTGAKTEARA